MFPTTYLLHATEEYCCGETFPVWISRLWGVDFTAAAFLWCNGIAMAAMVLAAWLAGRRTALRWLVVTLGTVVTVNSAAHAIGSLATWSYSPGLVTGLVLWLPLGCVVLRRTARELPPRRFVLGIVAGLAVHGVVTAIVLFA